MRKKKEPAPVRDELGFTPQDYEDMQDLKARGDLRGDTLCGRWDITREQVEAINEGDRFAVDMFFYVNEKLIRRLARTFLHNFRFSHGKYAYLLTVDDCFNQAYIDMRRGFLHFELDERCIVGLLCHSFRYASVGGFGDEDGVFYYRKRHKAQGDCVIAKQNGVEHVSTF